MPFIFCLTCSCFLLVWKFSRVLALRAKMWVVICDTNFSFCQSACLIDPLSSDTISACLPPQILTNLIFPRLQQLAYISNVNVSESAYIAAGRLATASFLTPSHAMTLDDAIYLDPPTLLARRISRPSVSSSYLVQWLFEGFMDAVYKPLESPDSQTSNHYRNPGDYWDNHPEHQQS